MFVDSLTGYIGHLLIVFAIACGVVHKNLKI